MIPQEMIFILSKELSDLWMLIDDITNYIEMQLKKNLIEKAEYIIKEKLGSDYRLANKADLLIDYCRTGAIYHDFLPFLIASDFNADGKFPDLAFLIINSNKNTISLIVLNEGESGPIILEQWKNLNASMIRYFPKENELRSPYEKYVVKMIGPGIEMITWGISSHVYYWDGKKYNRYTISD
jgi:hypothetical protein